jgi:hypothetical protein
LTFVAWISGLRGDVAANDGMAVMTLKMQFCGVGDVGKRLQ